VQHRHRIEDYLRCLLPSDSEMEDVFQELSMVVLRHATGPGDPATFATWCRGIARNLVMHHLRGKQRRGRVILIDELADIVDRAYDEAQGEKDGGELWDRRRAALQQCLTQLPDHDRELLRRRYVDEDDAAGLGRLLQRSPEAIRMKIMRLRQALERCIARKLAALPTESA
jgi:RNA polymerase sigma-70 factor (ECF subfamily)